ncbi:MAG: MFS transporter [Candidatus Hodarchaeota archaeon]
MVSTDSESKVHIFRPYWAIYFLTGCFSIAFSGIYISIVPLSNLFWPDESYHALEMGILISSMFLSNSLAGLLFGRLIDKYSRTKILFLIALVRGFCMIMLSLTIIRRGISSWIYFYIFTSIIGLSAGGNYPTIASLSDDMIPLNYRSRFFGIRNIIRSSFQLIGFVITGYLIELGLWRLFFLLSGLSLILIGSLMYLTIPEPKRGEQRKELYKVLEEESVSYDFRLNLRMMKKTIFSKTNLAALIEGIFTSLFMGSLTILFLPYIQTSPHNFSPFVTGLFFALFGLTGGLTLKLIFAKLSDKYSKKKDVRRIYLIILALTVGASTFVLLFYLPLPHLTVEEGKNILLFFSFPMIWIIGIIETISSSISSLYQVNQPPLLQEINLPEAQGQIVSLNRLLENIGWGLGPLIIGIFIELSRENYQLVALLIGIFAIPGIILWILSIKWYKKDKKEISLILEERAELLKSNQNGRTD